MTAHRGAKAWDHDYRAVIVGLDKCTNDVQRVYIQKDGFIVCGEHSHFPLERMAIAEAVAVFGIRQPREFSIANEAKADAYAEELRGSVLASVKSGLS